VLNANTQRWDLDGTIVMAECQQGRWRIDGRPTPDVHVADGIATVFDLYGVPFQIVDPLDVAASAAGDGNVVEAPMPGLVKAVFATPGAVVAEGDRLAVLEAMKMEHTITAPVDAVVSELRCAVDDQVDNGQVLIVLEDPDTE
jgi:3-methylcrotonyl-CoA carboxylase alpha subunit